MDKTAMMALLLMLGLLVACHEPATNNGVVKAAAQPVVKSPRFLFCVSEATLPLCDGKTRGACN